MWMLPLYLHVKQKSDHDIYDACKRNILLHSDQCRLVVPLHDYFRQAFKDQY